MKFANLIVALLVLVLCAIPISETAASSDQGIFTIQQEPGLHRGSGFGQHGWSAETARYGSPADRGPAQAPGRHGQESNAAESAREEMRRDPSDSDLLATIRRYRLGGYRRIFGRNVLEHETRHALHTIIVENPGVDLQALSLMTGIHPGTLRYHLDKLVNLGKIAVMEVGGVHRFYENHGRYDQRQKNYLAWQWYATTRKMIDLIRASPGISRGEIAGKIGISGPSATRWLKQFITEGIVNEVRDGRFSRYYIAAV